MEFDTGWGQGKLQIVGRPNARATETWVIVEPMPEEPIRMHWMPKLKNHMPHFRAPRPCPYCDEGSEPVPYMYVGAESRGTFGILELTWSCFATLAACARRTNPEDTSVADVELRKALSRVNMAMRDKRTTAETLNRLQSELECRRAERDEEMRLRPPDISVPAFVGLMCKISRGGSANSPRILRCEQRLATVPAWPFDTKIELARIWGIPMRPRIYKEA